MRRKVLVIDTSLYSRMILKDMLTTAGYSVCEASSRRQALENYGRMQPDVVMVDANLKECDGAKAIEELRRLDPRLVAIICASCGQRSVVSQAFSAGAIGYCAKPYKEKSIKDALKSMARQPVWN